MAPIARTSSTTTPDFAAFESLLADVRAIFGIEFHGLALMSNHFHALVRCSDDVVSESMHRVACIYAGRYNRRYERTGPLFEGRFKSVPIESDEQLLTVSRYIHRNPESIVGERALTAYRWSSYGAYLGVRPAPSWLTTDVVLEQFGSDPERFRRFVHDGPSIDPDIPSRPVDRVDAGPDEVEQAVARAADVEVASLHRSRRHVSNQPRLAAILLMHELRLATSPEIAERFEMGTAGAARQAARRARVLRSSDAGFRRLWERSRGELRSATTNK